MFARMELKATLGLRDCEYYFVAPVGSETTPPQVGGYWRNEEVKMTTTNIFDPIYVQYGTLKQTLYPYETFADISWVTNLGVCADDCVRIDVSEYSDDCRRVGLTLKGVRQVLKFGIPSSTTALRNGLPIGDDAQVLPGDEIEFSKKRKRRRNPTEPPIPASETPVSHGVQLQPSAELPVTELHDPTKLVVSQEDFCAHYKGLFCPLSPKPFAVLSALNHRAGKPVALETLRQKVWHDYLEVDDDTIQRQISVIRQKLKKAEITDISIDGKRPGFYTLVLK